MRPCPNGSNLAVEFIEDDMLTDEGLATWNAGSAVGALADISAGEAQSDPKCKARLRMRRAGSRRPLNPEMGAFWSSMGPALTNITTGAMSPKEALAVAAKRIMSGG